MVAVAAGGAFVAWLAHTSVDWLHNIPGVTGRGALRRGRAGGAVGAETGSARCPPASWRSGLVGLAAVAAADSVGRLAYADKDRIDARDSLRSRPRGGAAAGQPRRSR